MAGASAGGGGGTRRPCHQCTHVRALLLHALLQRKGREREPGLALRMRMHPRTHDTFPGRLAASDKAFPSM
eukprot:3624775-Pyramimonas_sp.AAC.1